MNEDSTVPLNEGRELRAEGIPASHSNGESTDGGEAIEPEVDETTGASPGTAQACDDLGLNSLEANLARFGIKPPGQ